MLAFDGDIMEYDCDIHGILTEYWVKLSRVKCGQKLDNSP